MKINWQTKKLSEVCKIIKGKNPILHTTKKEKYLPYLSAKFLRNTNVAEYASVTDKKSILVDNDEIIIICDGSNSGETFFGFKGIISSTMGKIVHNNNIATKYLNFFLLLVMEYLKSKKTGTAIPHLDIKGLLNLNILLPLLPEQHRIVKILDEVFENIAKAKENVEKNLQNSKDLFGSYLQSVFLNPKKDWEEKKLGKVYQIGSSKRVLKSQWRREGIPFYRGREITRLATDGYVNNELFISENHYSELLKQTGVPKSGDIVITAIGTIGNLHIVRESDKFYFKDASVLWLKRVTNVNSEFIKFWLKSNLFFDQLDRGNGATVDTLTIKKLQSVGLFLPPLKEQQIIVKKLNALSAETKKLEEIYKQKLADLEELKKSVLKKAFSGEL